MLLEVLRSARLKEARLLEAQFATLPCLPTPKDLWQRAIALGQACRQVGRTVLSLDLLVAAVDMHHNAVLVSCEANVEASASVSDLRLQRLERPSLIRRLPSRSTSACRAIHRSNSAGCSLLEATYRCVLFIPRHRYRQDPLPLGAEAPPVEPFGPKQPTSQSFPHRLAIELELRRCEGNWKLP